MHAAKHRDADRPSTFDDEKLYLVARIADDIAPNLADRPQDRGMACQMAWRMVQSYLPNSEAEILEAARIVSLSLTQLDLLRACAGTDLTPTLKLRLVGAAIALNRSITQTERTLARLQRAEDVRRTAPPARAGSKASHTKATTEAEAAMADLGMRHTRLRDEIARLEARAAKAKRDIAAAPAAETEPHIAADHCAANGTDHGTDHWPQPAADFAAIRATQSMPHLAAKASPAPTPEPLSHPVADPVGPASAEKPAAQPSRHGFDAAVDFKRRVAEAHCHGKVATAADPLVASAQSGHRPPAIVEPPPG